MTTPRADSKPNLGRILIVDDEEAMGRILTKSLAADGYAALAVTSPADALAAIPKLQPDVILTDIRMPGMTGQELLRQVRSLHPEIAVILMTAFGTIEDAVEVLKAGAFNYITKPFAHAQLLHQIRLALEHRRLQQENVRLAEQAEGPEAGRRILGSSAAVLRVRETIARAARTDSVVLVTGESGVGKELVAHAIHAASGRSARSFVPVNCPAIPPSLIESELFGYERGAFTGADRAKMGLIELSAGGTLFLDEIGEIPSETQVKLLRVIQEREIQRLGGLKQIPVDLRIVAATNRDLTAEIEARRFRSDLYYRLKVIHIEVPPLRERREDIPELVTAFGERLARRSGRAPMIVSDRLMNRLTAYDWPGNIRELENVVERMTAPSSGPLLDESNLPADLLPAPRPAEVDPAGRSAAEAWPDDYKEARDRFERQYFAQVLRAAEGSMAQAARLTGISRRHLYEKLEKLGMEKDREGSGRAGREREETQDGS